MEKSYHEPYQELTPETREIHRALLSLMEELEAVDWYQQRVDVTQDAELRAVLAHNRDEEIEHAAMTLEWLRRRVPKFDEELRTYLFTSAPIDQVEELTEAAEGQENTEENRQDAASAPGAGLGIGSLKKGDA